MVEEMSKETVLITSVGSVAGDIVIEKLKKEFRLIATDVNPRLWVANALSVDGFYQVPYVRDTMAYEKVIDEICEYENVSYIVPLTDVDVDYFNDKREWAKKRQITLCISGKKTIELVRNKKSLQDYIKDYISESGMPIYAVPTYYYDECKEKPCDFPIVCKPYNGRSSQGLRYIYSEADWEAIGFLKNHNLYIVEPMIDGYIVMVELVCQPEYDRYIAVTRRELLCTPNGVALTVEVFQNPDLEKACVELAKKLGIIGCVNFEFIIDDGGKSWFIECNPRFSAGAKFTCLAGYDCVNNHIRCFQDKKIDQYEGIEHMIIARKYIEYISERSKK